MKKIIFLFAFIFCLQVTSPTFSAPNTLKKIVFIGATGVGKSSLINSFYRQKFNADTSLISIANQPNICSRIYTQLRIRPYPLVHHYKTGSSTDSHTARIVEYQFKDQMTFVDTPGLDDTHGPDVQHKILVALQDYLAENADSIDSLVFVVNGTIERDQSNLKRVWDSLEHLLPISLTTNLDLMINFSDFSFEEQDRMREFVLSGCGLTPRNIYQVNLSYLKKTQSRDQGQAESLLALKRFLQDIEHLDAPLHLSDDSAYTQWVRQQIPQIFNLTQQLVKTENLKPNMKQVQKTLQQAQAFAEQLKANPNHQVPSISTEEVEREHTAFTESTETLDVPVVNQKVAYREKTVRVKTLWAGIKSLCNKMLGIPFFGEVASYVKALEPALNQVFPNDSKARTYQEPYIVDEEGTESVKVSTIEAETHTETETQTHAELTETEDPVTTYQLKRQQKIIDTCLQELEYISEQLQDLDNTFNAVHTDFQDSLNQLAIVADSGIEQKTAFILDAVVADYPHYFDNNEKRQAARMVISRLFSQS